MATTKKYKHSKVLTLPSSLHSDSFYYVKNEGRFDAYLTDSNGVAISQNVINLTSNQNIGGVKTFMDDIIGNKFIKSGGTANQFLKADGSVDSINYYHSGNIPVYDNYNSWNLFSNGVNRGDITSGETVGFEAIGAINLNYSTLNNNTLTFSHSDTSNVNSTNNTGRTYIQNIDLDDFGHITGLTTSTETVINTNDYITTTNFDTLNGNLTLTTLSGNTIVENLDGRYSFTGHTHQISDITNFPTDISFFNNDVGYITGFTDTNYYLDNLSFNTSTGVLTASVNGIANQTVDLDGRYSLTGHTHVIADITDFPTDISFFNNDVGYITGFTNTTYSTSVINSTGDAIIRLSGSDSSTDDITLVGGENTSLGIVGDTITINSVAGELEAIDEGNGIGYALRGRNPDNYGNIGLNAVDLSQSSSSSSSRGATGDYSFASGLNVIASDDYSHAEGQNTIAGERWAHAEGLGNTASGNASHVEGNFNTASGGASHAEGRQTLASGSRSHAEGYQNTASGDASHAEGFQTTASGNNSHTEGEINTASGMASHAQGRNNFARGFAEHSGGINGTDYTPVSGGTISHPTDRLVNYGNGLDSINRSDAFTIYKNGAVKFFRELPTNITNASAGFFIYDSGNTNRPTIHNGSDWKGLAYLDDITSATSGTTDTFVNKSGDTMSGSLVIKSDNKPSIKLEQNNSSYNGVLLSETGFGYLEIKPSNDKYGFLLRSFDSNDWFVGGVIGNNQNTFNSLLSGDGYNLARLGYHIYTGDNTDMPVMSFNVDKNVGIGTTTPTEKLDVDGNIKIQNSLLSNQENLAVSAGTETIASISSTTYTAAFFDFVIKNGLNLRAGTIYMVHDGTNVEYTETSTNDLGDTSDVSLSVILLNGNITLQASTTTNTWEIKSLVRGL